MFSAKHIPAQHLSKLVTQCVTHSTCHGHVLDFSIPDETLISNYSFKVPRLSTKRDYPESWQDEYACIHDVREET